MVDVASPLLGREPHALLLEMIEQRTVGGRASKHVAMRLEKWVEKWAERRTARRLARKTLKTVAGCLGSSGGWIMQACERWW
jgi:hypothetical protein